MGLARWLYCARETVSVALRAGSFNYPLHGHDLTVEACICSDVKEHVDLVDVQERLRGVLRPLDYKTLESVGLSTMEDVAEKVAGELGACVVRVYTPRGTMIEYLATGSADDTSTG